MDNRYENAVDVLLNSVARLTRVLETKGITNADDTCFIMGYMSEAEWLETDSESRGVK